MHRVPAIMIVACLALALTAADAVAEPSGPSGTSGTSGPSAPTPKPNKRCAIVTALIPTATGVAAGNVSSAPKQARILRDLADRELTPKKVKTALRAVADWFEAARDRSVGERALKLAALKRQIAVIVAWGGKICGEPIVTTTTGAA
jgi:hypothetical protein